MRLPRRLRHGEEASLVEHLDELRTRLVISLITLGIAFAIAFAFHDRLVEWLTRPLPPDHPKLITYTVTEPFVTSIKVSLYAAFALALPVLLYQLWSFLAPAIEENAQRGVAAFAAIGTVLFAIGLAFAYWIVLPKALNFLTNYDSHLYDIQVRASSYFSFASLTLMAIALVFELPIFILALVWLRVLSSDQLRSNRRIGYVVMIVAAVLLPTVDPVSLLFEVVPLVLLFEGSIWLAVLMERRWRRSSEAELAAG